MCGMGVDLEESSSGEEEKDQEEYGMGEGVRMLLPPPPAHSEEGAWGARRGPAACLAWGAGLVLWNVGVATACLLILAAVFALVLLPVALLLYAGFLCHSRRSDPPHHAWKVRHSIAEIYMTEVMNSQASLCRYLEDNSCSALIILGFVMMSPLVVVAAATFCGLARRLHLFLLFQPIARACYRGERCWVWGGDVRAWV